MTPVNHRKIRRYASAVGVIDFLTLTVVSLGTYLVSFGSFVNTDNLDTSGDLRLSVSPQLLGAGILVAWLISLAVFRTRDLRIVGSDFAEYKRLLNSSLAVFGLLAFAELFFKVDVSRLYVVSIMVAGTFALLLTRRISRRWLARQRIAGKYRRRVALYGPANELQLEQERYKSSKDFEFEAACTVTGETELEIKDIATGEIQKADLAHLAEILAERNVEILQVVGSSPSTARIQKTLYWALDGWEIVFVVSPAITGVSNSKINTRVVAGIPQMEIKSTKFTGGQYALKSVLDLTLGLIAFLVSLPVVLIAAVFVKLEDKGPAFFSQTRVGVNGKEFKIYKLRSMRVGAELQHLELQKAQAPTAANSVMFKDPEDPRVTKTGKFIRKYSIDELPQFLNVLKGNMSMVGPRPPLVSEVEEWKTYEVRRLLVKPGVTGPWQIGGRSNLTWEETVAIDLNYVENWSVLQDVSIIFRTINYILNTNGLFR
jgi:exopolysaccharide biosynthesis polyprenyl glycosylphosphotransferase